VRAALAIPVVLAAVGCGGEDSLSRSEWAARANAICLETLKQVEALGQPVSSDDYLRITPKVQELGRKGIERLRDLDAPRAIADDAERMIEGYENVVKEQDVVYAGLKALRQGEDPPGDRNFYRAGNRAIEHGKSADEIARRLRARECARDPWQTPSQT
jgi:hypothetical protein